MFYLLYFWCSTLHSMKSAQVYTILDILDACVIICSYFGNTFFIFFYEDRECCFTYFAKTFKWTYKLSPYSKMNVRLALQVLSFVSKVLLFFYLLHFWCSILHLMKSAKHCLYNCSRYTWCMCDNDKFILSIFHDISCQNFQMNISGWDLT